MTSNIHLSHSEGEYFGGASGYEEEKNDRRLDRICRLRGAVHGLRLLEVGVAYGAFLLAARARGMEVAGMDLDPELLQRCAARLGPDVVRLGYAERQWPFEDGSFDVVVLFDVLEHLEDPRLALWQAARCLKARGSMLLTTPNRRLGYLLRRLPLVGIPDSNSGHVTVRGRRFWMHLIHQAGFEPEEVWFGEHLGHLRGMTMLDRLAKKLGADPARVRLFDPLQLSLGIAATKSA